MVALKAGDVDTFLKRPDPQIAVFLVYGPDSGLVHERAAHLAKSAVDDPNDPFAMVRLDGDDAAGDSTRLIDEALTVPLFGGRRAVWVRLGSRNIVPAVEQLVSGPPLEARVVIEAGDLKKGAPIRALCEKARNAAAIPCYADSEAAIGRLIDTELAAAGLSIDRDARSALLELLGADRIGTRQEIEKLAIYAKGQKSVTLADIDAVVADASALALDDVVDAAFAGDSAALEQGLTTLEGEGTPIAAAVTAALGHALRLHRLRIEVEAGGRAGAVLDKGWPMLHFRRRGAVEGLLGRASAERLGDAVRRLADAVADGRKSGPMADIIGRRAIAILCEEMRRR